MKKISDLFIYSFRKKNTFHIFIKYIFKILPFKQGVVNERQYIRKRLYGLSPFIDCLIPNPKDGKTRAILSKKINLESFFFLFYPIFKKKKNIS